MTKQRALFGNTLIGAVLVVAVAVAPSVGGAAAPPSTAHGGDIQFQVFSHQFLCLSIDEAQGAPVLASCTADVRQRFMLSDGADGLNLLLDRRGECLSRGAKLAKDFYAVAVGPCRYQAKEKWSFLVTGEITQPGTHRCLAFSVAAADVAVNLVPCDGSNKQIWKLSQ